MGDLRINVLQSGGLTSDEFKVALQEATNFPLRPHVLPFLKTHIPYLQRDIASMARSCNLVSIFRLFISRGKSLGLTMQNECDFQPKFVA